MVIYLLSFVVYYRPIRKMGKVLFSQVSVCLSTPGGYPVPDSFSRQWSQVLSGGTPIWGTPQPGQDWGTSPAKSAWGTPLARTGVPTPLPRQNSRASTCYTASGMPLAFTQEDFLIHVKFVRKFNSLRLYRGNCKLKSGGVPVQQCNHPFIQIFCGH